MVTGVQFEWLATGRGQMAPSRETVLDSVSAVDALLVDDSLEQRLLVAFREAPVRARLALVELMEELASQRTGRPRGEIADDQRRVLRQPRLTVGSVSPARGREYAMAPPFGASS